MTAFRGVMILVLLLAGCAQSTARKDIPLDQQIKAAFEAGELDGLHSVLILKRDETLAELHFPGDDQRWGRPLGRRDHGPDALHDLRSVTKSIVGLLYGIALSEGKVPPLDAPILSAFPQYSDLADDPDRKAILVRHALSMKMGTEWDEDLPYTDPKNSEIAMERAQDRYRYILDRPMVNKPGDWWTYNGGATAVIAKLIADGTGQPLDAYAQDKLFSPLGIENFEWVRGADGEPSAASGLRMNIHDLAKIGQMIQNRGAYGGQQIVPADWLDQSFTSSAKLETGLRYGFFWWLAPEGDPPYWRAGFGNGGQRLSTNRGPAKLVITVFAGNYDDPDAWKVPAKITDIVFANLPK